MTRYELVILWDDGEKEVFGYATEEDARKAGAQYRTQYGSQVWTQVRKVVCG